MAETKKSVIARNAVISRVSELDICSVRSQRRPPRTSVLQAIISVRCRTGKRQVLPGRVVPDGNQRDIQSLRNLVFRRFFMPTRAGRGTDARCRLCPSAGRRPRVSGAFCTFRKPEGRRDPVRFRLPQAGRAQGPGAFSFSAIREGRMVFQVDLLGKTA